MRSFTTIDVLNQPDFVMFHILQRKFHSGEWILEKPSRGNDTVVGMSEENENNQNSPGVIFFL